MQTTDQLLPNEEQIPENYVVSLSNFGAIALSGEEYKKYLQGQVTCDVTTLDEHPLLIGAHCNAKGKVFSCFRLIERNQQLLLMQPKTSIAASLAELQKFGVFAKVTIEQADQLSFWALIGNNAAELMQQAFQHVPDNLTPVIHTNGATLVYVAGDINRYLIITDSPTCHALEQLSLPMVPDKLWELSEITQGFPFLSNEHIDQYVPQMLNMQAIHGISFTKGCYLGQETVARMQYLGKNKRAMFALKGQAQATTSPADVLEIQLGDNWRKAGDIVAIYQSNSNQTFIQAVLASDVSNASVFRIKGQEESLFSILPLPYSLGNN